MSTKQSEFQPENASRLQEQRLLNFQRKDTHALFRNLLICWLLTMHKVPVMSWSSKMDPHNVALPAIIVIRCSCYAQMSTKQSVFQPENASRLQEQRLSNFQRTDTHALFWNLLICWLLTMYKVPVMSCLTSKRNTHHSLLQNLLICWLLTMHKVPVCILMAEAICWIMSWSSTGISLTIALLAQSCVSVLTQAELCDVRDNDRFGPVRTYVQGSGGKTSWLHIHPYITKKKKTWDLILVTIITWF